MPWFSEAFGINKFSGTRQALEAGEPVRIFLNGFKDASSVILMGIFPARDDKRNLPMDKTEQGWEKTLTLEPGKYFYHFQVDEKIITDPTNTLLEPDEEGLVRSVLYVPNYCFELSFHAGASRVFVAGNFNHWHADMLEMKCEQGVWRLPVFLKDGTYAYKFIVDGRWITDPQNPVLHPDGNGNYNSYLAIGPTTVFRLYGYTNAHEVLLAGNFNMWNYTELHMQKTASGWELPYALSQGVYEYKFVVDGEWMTDPVNPFYAYRPYGTNSLITVQPNHTFRLKGYKKSEKVVVSGTFNNWDNENFVMVRNQGYWEFPICLMPGRYSYLFIVDGLTLCDPEHQDTGRTEYGVECSHITIEAE